MAFRFGYWGAGVGLGFIALMMLRGTSWSYLAPLTFLGCVVMAGLLAELALAVRSLRTRPHTRTLLKADGIVDLIAFHGAITCANTADPRLAAFVEWDPTVQNAEVSFPVAGQRFPSALVGRVAIVSVFLGRDGRSWTENEIADAYDALARAGRWLEREAIRYDAPLNVSLATTYFVADNEVEEDVEVTFVREGAGEGPIEARAMMKALRDLSRAASQLGFHDAQDWLARVNPRIDADAHVWILHPMRSGRSLAIPPDLTELEGVSLAVCYAREASFPEPLIGPAYTDPVTIVHELLHIFGATDKYGVSLRSFPDQSVTSHDIMRLSKSRLSNLRVDPGTAREIGWKVELP